MHATQPGIPSESEARALLAGLAVGTPTDDGSYDRDLFPHWHTVEGSCSTREYVLRRDGDGVETGVDCYPTAGAWTSPYDGATHDDPSDISIDHMVPLKNAWIVRFLFPPLLFLLSPPLASRLRSLSSSPLSFSFFRFPENPSYDKTETCCEETPILPPLLAVYLRKCMY